MGSLGRILCNRIIKPEVLKKYSSALEIDPDQEDIESVFLGGATNFTTNRLLDLVYEEFLDYQSLPEEVFPSEAREEAKVVGGNDQEQTAHYRIDVLWWYISQINVPESGMSHFKELFKLPKLCSSYHRVMQIWKDYSALC